MRTLPRWIYILGIASIIANCLVWYFGIRTGPGRFCVRNHVLSLVSSSGCSWVAGQQMVDPTVSQPYGFVGLKD